MSQVIKCQAKGLMQKALSDTEHQCGTIVSVSMSLEVRKELKDFLSRHPVAVENNHADV